MQKTLMAMVFAIAAPLSAWADGVPVMIQANDMPGEWQACPANSIVVGLDPKGDNFLSLRAGPGGKYPEIGRLGPRQLVLNCDQRGPWRGVVIQDGVTDCNYTNDNTVDRPYSGPCPSGWVHGKYLKMIAG